ncbi:MAG: chemotaxis protein CheW [Pseudanabaenales cyanobacterium]|nr:chemotaxis protein CheW [Pseudanabaenales cyanobacterium]
MAFSSLSRLSRRTKQKSTEAIHKLIVFKIRQEWFALPILAAQKVVELGKIYGNVQGNGTGLTRYQNQDLPVIDIEQRIFGSFPHPCLPSSPAAPALPEQSIQSDPPSRHLLIIHSPHRELTGFPLTYSPQLRRAPESAFAPLPSLYRDEGIIRCVNALITPSPAEPSMFLLDLAQLLPRRSLPLQDPIHALTSSLAPAAAPNISRE